MASATFDGVTLYSIEVLDYDQLGTVGGTLYRFSCTIRCQTDTYANYTAVAAKAGHVTPDLLHNGKYAVQTVGGTSGSLVLDGITYTTCYITNISAAEKTNSDLGGWQFTVSFVKDTS